MAERWTSGPWIPEERVFMGLVLLSAYPLAWCFRSLPALQGYAARRHAFSLAISLPLLLLGYPPRVVRDCLGACLLVWLGSRAWSPQAWWPPTVFLGLLGLLALYHLHSQWWEPDSPDVSTPIMVLVMRLSLYAWSVHDRTRATRGAPRIPRVQQVSDPSGTTATALANAHAPAGDADAKVPADSGNVGKAKAAVADPTGEAEEGIWTSLLEFLGYCFFFPGWLVGPVLDFDVYRDFIRQHGHFAPSARPPSPAVEGPALRVFALGLACFAVYAGLGEAWSFDTLINPAFLARSSFLYRCACIPVAGFVARAKYYAVWKLAEGANLLAGLAYQPAHPANAPPRLDLAENANMWALESAQSPRDFINSWNIKTSHWLRRSVYSRVLHRHGPGAALFATYLASAFWHGFHPGYYLTFLSAALVSMASKVLRRRLRPLVLGLRKAPGSPWKRVYDVAGWALTQVAVNYVCGPFPLQSLERGLRLWASVSYIVHVGALLVLVLDAAWPPLPRRKHAPHHGSGVSVDQRTDALDGGERVVDTGANVGIGVTRAVQRPGPTGEREAER